MALMRKEFSMAVGETYYGLVTYYTEEDIAGSSAVRSHLQCFIVLRLI